MMAAFSTGISTSKVQQSTTKLELVKSPSAPATAEPSKTSMKDLPPAVPHKPGGSALSFGARLKREREMRNIKLEDIAESTKISRRYLNALETENLKQLPGGIFSKGFVRSYARYLGIDEEQAVADFVALRGAAETKSEAEMMATIAEAKARAEAAAGIRRSDRSGLFMAAAVVLVIAVGAGGLAYKHFVVNADSYPGAASASSTTAATPTTKDAPSDSATPGTVAPELNGTAIAGERFRLALSAREQSWVQVTSDDKVLLEGVLEAGAERSFEASKRLVVKMGNAGGVALMHNGKSRYEFASGTKTRTITFDSSGIVR